MKWLLVMLIAGSTADLVTTEFALRHPGAREANVLMQNQSVRYAAKIAAPVGVWYLTKPLSKKWRIISCIAASAVWGYMAQHNWRMNARGY